MSAAFWRLRSASVSPVGAIACSGTSVAPSGRVNGTSCSSRRIATDEEVDVVDVALRVRVPALDLDLVGERLGLVRHEEEVVGWEPPEDECSDESEQAEDDRDAGEALQDGLTGRG